MVSSTRSLAAILLTTSLLSIGVTFSAQAQLASLPAVPEPAENPLTGEKAVLGKILFWDQQLSTDNTVACGTCHSPADGGADPALGNHPGADGVFGNADDVVGSPGVARRDASGELIADSTSEFDTQVTGRFFPTSKWPKKVGLGTT